MKRFSTLMIISLFGLMVVAQNVNAQARDNTRDGTVISPYYQAASTGGIYTFVGISHPSLNGSASQIGLTLTAQGATGSSGSANPSVTYTISAGTTTRVFISATNTTIAPGVPAAASSVLRFISTTSGSDAFGLLRATSTNGANPSLPITNPGSTTLRNNLSQLSFWGAVVILSTSSGFAMEFIGDAHDSGILSNTLELQAVDGLSSGAARGIN